MQDQLWAGYELTFTVAYAQSLSVSNALTLSKKHSKCLRNQGRTKGEGWSTAN